MSRDRIHVLFLNAGHFLDHLVTLVFATVAALALTREWGMAYGDLVPYATPGFIAFGIFALPAGWLADRWSRRGMMAVFFIGIGIASIVTGFSRSPLEIACGLFVVGMFAAIYHPVGLALIVDEAKATGFGMAIASNGVWGNLGVGSAALIAGYFIDNGGWRLAFIVPGAVACLLGIAYAALFVVNRAPRIATAAASVPAAAAAASAGGATAFANPGSRSGARVGALAHREPEHHRRSLIVRLGAIVLFTTALSGLIFQSTTFALPKIFDERLGVFAGSASTVGWITFLVFAVASLAQLLVGRLIDQVGPRRVFVTAAIVQASAFALMPGLTGAAAVAAAIAFTFGAFGQIPINDYMIGRLASPERRASIYGVRFVVTFVVLAAALPLVATVHAAWGFDALFRILACAALLVLAAAWALPRNLPENLDAAPDAAPAKPA